MAEASGCARKLSAGEGNEGTPIQTRLSDFCRRRLSRSWDAGSSRVVAAPRVLPVLLRIEERELEAGGLN
jgi:hypothetical protein